MEQVMELLKELATQLGIAVEYLWTTLIRQQYAEGITNIVMAGITIITLVLLVILAARTTKYMNSEYQRLRTSRENGEGTGYRGSSRISSIAEDNYSALRFAIPISAAVISIILLVVIERNLVHGIQRLINPDYFALREILDLLESGSMR